MRFLTEKDYLRSKDFNGEWGIFYVSSGRKFFIKAIYKRDLTFNEAGSGIKLSDESVIKTNQELALKIAAANNTSFYNKKVGIVNRQGLQILL